VPFVPPITSGYVIKVYDGDTITIAGRLPYPESPLYRFSVRLLGIDSPEIKGKTEKEKEAAHKSQRALEGLVLNKTVLLREISTEKYGRILANVYLVTDTEELLVNKWMLANGHAVPYDGKTKQPFDSDSPVV
jgi:endonuclease YncB( thermonuclease family)